MGIKIFREHYIQKLDRRADAIVFLSTEDMGYVFLLECVHEEKEDYLNSKIRSWKEWPDATDYLSRLTGVHVPHFDIIVLREGEQLCEKLPVLD
jgi:hypothetical protein